VALFYNWNGVRHVVAGVHFPTKTMKKYKNPVCRGSIELGNACLKCERCADELKKRQKKNGKKTLTVKKNGEVIKEAQIVKDKQLFTIWDNDSKDYGFSIFLEVPVFKKMEACMEVVKMWNEQAAMEGKKRKYSLIEVKLTRKKQK